MTEDKLSIANFLNNRVPPRLRVELEPLAENPMALALKIFDLLLGKHCFLADPTLIAKEKRKCPYCEHDWIIDITPGNPPSITTMILPIVASHEELR